MKTTQTHGRIGKALVQAIKTHLDNNPGGNKRLETDAGLSHGSISRMLTGERMLSMESIDKLCDFLNLDLVQR